MRVLAKLNPREWVAIVLAIGVSIIPLVPYIQG
jgi:hypothetical protein